MAVGEGDGGVAGGVAGAGVQDGDAAAHQVKLVAGGLQPDVVPFGDGAAAESVAGAVHCGQGGEQVGFVAAVGVKAGGVGGCVGAVADGREVGVKAYLQGFGQGFGQGFRRRFGFAGAGGGCRPQNYQRQCQQQPGGAGGWSGNAPAESGNAVHMVGISCWQSLRRGPAAAFRFRWLGWRAGRRSGESRRPEAPLDSGLRRNDGKRSNHLIGNATLAPPADCGGYSGIIVGRAARRATGSRPFYAGETGWFCRCQAIEQRLTGAISGFRLAPE